MQMIIITIAIAWAALFLFAIKQKPKIKDITNENIENDFRNDPNSIYFKRDFM